MTTDMRGDESHALSGKNFLITGAEGMLGRAFSSTLNDIPGVSRVYALGKSELDVRSRDMLSKYKDLDIDFIIHCAALVDADYCEDHYDEAEKSIVGGTRNIIDLAKSCHAKVFYPQSFLVYDGVMLPIDEMTKPRPLCNYGQLKYMAEIDIREQLVDSLVVRMGGFFGGYDVDNNFVGRIIPHIAKLLSEGKNYIEIGDRVWQPTYTIDLARNSLELLGANKSGVYCMASHGFASFYDLTVEIVKILGLDERFEIRAVSADKISRNERAVRPSRAIMVNRLLSDQKIDQQRSWQASLSEYVNHSYFKDLFK